MLRLYTPSMGFLLLACILGANEISSKRSNNNQIFESIMKENEDESDFNDYQNPDQLEERLSIIFSNPSEQQLTDLQQLFSEIRTNAAESGNEPEISAKDIKQLGTIFPNANESQKKQLLSLFQKELEIEENTDLASIPTISQTQTISNTTDTILACASSQICTHWRKCRNVTMEDFRRPHTCPARELCCKEADRLEKADMPTKPNGCGYHNPYGVTLDMPNGESEATTSIGEFPWVVAILDYARRTEKIYGGTLIAPNVVLTAAHSLRGKAAEDLRVIAGEWDPQRTTEAYPNQTILVKEIIIHESYSVSAPFYNIALLLLQNHFRLDVHINPICLPDTQVRFDFENCYAAGWQKGAFFADNTNSPAMLQKEKLSVIPHTDCQNTLRKRTSEYFELHHHFICAGGGEKYVNACVGNAGTALMCPIKNSPNRYYIAGIDSWNLGCNKENTPEVFVSVTKLRLWIAWKLNVNNVHFKYYTFP